jgi:fimbrial chaperone protein
VASPPAAKLAPKSNYVVRVVRVTKRPVSGEESYRVLIDQLPEGAQQKGNAVNLLVRYSIPVSSAPPIGVTRASYGRWRSAVESSR